MAIVYLSGVIHLVTHHKRPSVPQIDTVYVWKHDTVKVVESHPAGTVVVKLPVYIRDTILSNYDNTSTSDNNTSTSDNKDTIIVRDSAQVEVPIEQRTYEGENYRAVVQGFRPELVSIDIRIPEAAAPKRKWWSVTVGPQVGFGFTPKGWEPYAGIGITAGICF